jgi:hypothetical protein
MAIYHLHIQTINRAAGQSAVAAAAYRSTSRLLDERTGEVCDYTRKDKALKSGIELPAEAPAWAGDRARLWNEVEQKENRKNSILAYEMNVAIPAELEKPDREKLIKTYCRTLTEIGLVCDWSIHAPDKKGDQRNFHAHIMFTTRKFENGGWSKNKLQMNRDQYSNFINDRRESWENCANAALLELHKSQTWDRDHRRKEYKDRNGFYPPNEKVPEALTIDRQTLAAQNIARPAQRHQGPTAMAMERKGKKQERTKTPKPAEENIQGSAEFEKETELKAAQLALKLLSSSPENWEKELARLERFRKSEGARARAISVKQFLPEIEKANVQEIRKATEIKNELLKKMPQTIPEKPNVFQNLFYEYQAGDGKSYPYEKFVTVQKAIIESWNKSIHAVNAKGEGLNKERGLITAVKRDPESLGNTPEAVKRWLQLGAEQETRRPELFSKIKTRTREILDTAREFLAYRKFKAVFAEVREAREETARLEQTQTRSQKPRGRSR